MRRRAGELFGLVAYLSVMYGRLPDRDLLAAAFGGGLDDVDEPRLRLVVSNDRPETIETPANDLEEVAA